MPFVRKTYTCELLTPLIMSGADQTRAELRAASIKGVMRWWWRALQGIQDIEKLRIMEFDLFGGVLGDTQRKSQVSVAVHWLGEPIIKPVNQYTSLSADAVKYLAYGAGLADDNPVRPAFVPGQSFVIQLKYPKVHEKTMDIVMGVMLAYGGFGMKSKNGFGQVYSPEAKTYSINKRDNQSLYANFNQWDQAVVGKYNETYRAHEAVANAYYKSKNPRQQGPGSVRGTATLDSSGDKNLFAAHTPKQFQLAGSGKDLERKAKPVQLYVRRTPTSEYEAGILAFPYDLQLSVKGNVSPPQSKGAVISMPQKSHNEVVKQFMDNVRQNTLFK